MLRSAQERFCFTVSPLAAAFEVDFFSWSDILSPSARERSSLHFATPSTDPLYLTGVFRTGFITSIQSFFLNEGQT